MSNTFFPLAAIGVATLLVACAGAPPAQGDSGSSVTAPVIEVASASPADPREVPTAPQPLSAAKERGDDCIADLLAGHQLRTPAGQPDQQLYVEGHDAMLAGDTPTARKKLLELTERHKRSSFVPLAYLLFGEMFADEAQSDPSKAPIAANFYREVVKFPPADNPGNHYAHLRLGDTYVLMSEHAKALMAYRQALDARAKRPQAACMQTVADSATKGLIAAYAEVGDPRKAHAFLRPLSGDPRGSNDKTFAMMTLLAHLQAPKDTSAAVVVVRDILRRAPKRHACEELRQLARVHAALEARVGAAVRSTCP